MKGRFSYVQYDDDHKVAQENAKCLVENLEEFIEGWGPSRPASLALTKLEEVYMWIGKMIRDDQAAAAAEHVPDRTNA